MIRALQLFYLSLFHSFHRLRHDLAREMVVGICALVLGGLFYYVFNDFLNVEIQSFSDGMRRKFGNALALCLLLVMASACGRLLKREWQSPHNFARAARALGEEKRVIILFWLLRLPCLVLLFHLPTWYLCLRSLCHWAPTTSLGIAGAMLALTLATMLWGLHHPQHPAWEPRSPLLSAKPYGVQAAMVIWRLKQMTLRNRPSQFCFLLAALFNLLLALLVGRQAPVLAPLLAAYLSGLMVALAMAVQVSYDLSSAWLERNLGVSHERYEQTLQYLAWLLGLGNSLLAGLAYGLPVWLGGLSPDGGSRWELIKGELPIFFITFVAPFVVPYLIFQIDARRVGIQVITVSLISLFLATAIYASLFSLVLLPLLAYYGSKMQAGRFYRAS